MKLKSSSRIVAVLPNCQKFFLFSLMDKVMAIESETNSNRLRICFKNIFRLLPPPINVVLSFKLCKENCLVNIFKFTERIFIVRIWPIFIITRQTGTATFSLD